MSEQQHVVVVGASAGGVEALQKFVQQLPPEFDAPVCIVLHIPADAPSLLVPILSRESQLPVSEAVDDAPLEAGRVYVAPPDRHLILSQNRRRVRVTRGPRENRHRPAVDPLFRSAAAAFGPGAIGIILSGTMDDGTAGQIAIKACGGVAIVQDPREALYPSMPQSAIANASIDHVVSLTAMGELLTRRVAEPVSGPLPPIPKDMHLEVRMAELEADAFENDARPGHPSPYSCPDCGGVLWEIQDGGYARYRCRVGHAYAPEAMLEAQEEGLEEALWSAMKTLEETARLSQRLAEVERARGHEWMSRRFAEKEEDARRRAQLIRRYLLRDDATVPVEVPVG
ncbi:MAG TPA: chemotaxis protein CheB [Thermoanaerobaculia bacterium]|nr:chemotaxis protein CheB [Thermoanaerobaculia bacterium]